MRKSRAPEAMLVHKKCDGGFQHEEYCEGDTARGASDGELTSS